MNIGFFINFPRAIYNRLSGSDTTRNLAERVEYLSRTPSAIDDKYTTKRWEEKVPGTNKTIVHNRFNMADIMSGKVSMPNMSGVDRR